MASLRIGSPLHRRHLSLFAPDPFLCGLASKKRCRRCRANYLGLDSAPAYLHALRAHPHAKAASETHVREGMELLWQDTALLKRCYKRPRFTKPKRFFTEQESSFTAPT